MTAMEGATASRKASEELVGLPWCPAFSTSARTFAPESIRSASAFCSMSPVKRKLVPPQSTRRTRLPLLGSEYVCTGPMTWTLALPSVQLSPVCGTSTGCPCSSAYLTTLEKTFVVYSVTLE